MLNIKEMATESNKIARPTAKAGSQPARLVSIVDLGVQKREFQGEVKTPVRKVWFNFELVNDTYEVNGQAYTQRVSTRPLTVSTSDKATLTGFLKSVDPGNTINGQLDLLLGKPFLVSVIHAKGKGDKSDQVYANFGGVVQVPDGFPVKEPSEPPYVFSFNQPDAVVAKRLPFFVREWIKAAEGYTGSATETVIAAVEAEIEKENNADAPF